MTSPVIGLTTYRGKNEYGAPTVALVQDYVMALTAAGGAPILIPSDLDKSTCASVFKHLDGILFSGGGDIAVERFNGELHPKVADVDQERDEVELELLRLALQHKKPFLGICRGIQLINVGTGGTLYTDIRDQVPDAIKHDFSTGFPRNHRAHFIEVNPESRLAKLIGSTSVTVNSLHHQCIKEIGSGIEPVAYTPDGLIEALEIRDHPFAIGVQWHPECLSDLEPMKRLFRYFVEAAGSQT
jgi:putative glutamine amidotransferase